MAAQDDRVWTIQELLTWTQEYFKNHGVDSPRLDAELLLAHALGVARIFLYAHYDKPTSAEERATFRALVKRRAKREPVAYILGHREFYGRDFVVNRDVLIPRPETEHVVEVALAWLSQAGLQQPKILDLCTGSGAIAITVACELEAAQVVATDISAPALALAAQNAQRLGVQQRIEWRQGSLWEPVVGERFDAIVANPPYVETTVRDTLQPEVREYEPGSALFAGADGLDILRTLVQAAPMHLKRPGLLAVEIGAGQAEKVKELIQCAGFAQVRAVQDLAGHDRVIEGLLR